MEQNNGGDNRSRSERLTLSNDVTTSNIKHGDSLDNDITVGYPFSSSSSSSFSCSDQFEVDIGENDAQFLESEENDSFSVILNPESPSMIGTLPQTCGSNTLYGSPKQSPPIQVMGQPGGYDHDLNQVPSSMYGPKHRTNSEWSLASNESLFSIHTGNNSFSMDGGFFLSKSGEFNWIDDHSCFTPDATSPSLPTVMDTPAENGESGEKEDATDPRNMSRTDSFSTVPDRKGANFATISRLSDASFQSTSSFAFPVLAKVEAETPHSPGPPPSRPPAAEAAPKAQPTITKPGGNQWFHRFSCFPMCC